MSDLSFSVCGQERMFIGRFNKYAHAGGRLFLSIFVLFALAVAFPGCGGGGSEDGGSAAVEGRDVKKADHLAGIWLRETPGMYLGFEFTKEGKVLATMDGGHYTTTMSYSLLDAGRLSMVVPGGATTVYAAVMDKDRLQLTAEGTGSTQIFQRLPKGKTLVIAAQEQAQARAAEQQRRLEGLQKFLESQDLVIVKAEDVGPASVIAIRFMSQGANIGGELIMDDSPAQPDPLRPIRVHAMSGQVRPESATGNSLIMDLNVHPASAIESAQPVSGRIHLNVTGSADKPVVKGKASFPGVWMGEADVVLKADRRAHEGVVKRLEAQRQAIRDAMDSVAAVLGGRALLSGEKVFSSGQAAQPVSLTLERVDETDRYTGVATVGTSSFNVNANLGVVINQGALYISFPNGETWRFHVDEGGKQLSGLWRPNPRVAYVGYGDVSLKLDRMWTPKAVADERAAMTRFLDADLSTAQAFAGFVEVLQSSRLRYWPVWVRLQNQGNGVVAGQAWLPGEGGGVNLSGQLRDRHIDLRATGAMEGGNIGRMAQQQWQLQLESMDPAPRFAGSMRANLGGGGKVELWPAGNAKLSRDAVRRALSDTVYEVVNLSISQRPEPAYFRFQSEASGKVSGDVIGGDMTARNPSTLPPGLISGEIVEEWGHTLVKLVIDGSANITRGREGARFEFTLAPRLEDDVITFTGWDMPDVGNQAWLSLVPVDSRNRPEPNAEQRFKLAAQRVGAGLAAPQNPVVGEKVLLMIQPTERDTRVGQIYTAEGRYAHGNSIPRVALHSGVVQVDEFAVVQLTYGAPFTEPTVEVEQNGIKSTRGTFRANNTVPSFTIERVRLNE